MKIIGICGSLRENSQTQMALEIVMHKVAGHDVTVELLNLRDFHLPFFDGTNDYPAFPDVNKLRDIVKSSDGIVLATPEYHSNVSGVLKNALDLLDFEHAEGKVFALISVVGGPSSSNAINSLRIICRSLHAWVIPEQVIISESGQAFDENGETRDPHLKKRLHDLADQLVKHATTLRVKS